MRNLGKSDIKKSVSNPRGPRRTTVAFNDWRRHKRSCRRQTWCCAYQAATAGVYNNMPKRDLPGGARVTFVKDSGPLQCKAEQDASAAAVPGVGGQKAQEAYQEVLSMPSTAPEPPQNPPKRKAAATTNKRRRITATPASASAMTRAAFVAVEEGSVEQLNELVEAGFRVKDARDTYGWSLLHVAASLGNEFMCEYLMAVGADVNATDPKGISPCMAASKNGHGELTELLTEDKAAELIQQQAVEEAAVAEADEESEPQGPKHDEKCEPWVCDVCSIVVDITPERHQHSIEHQLAIRPDPPKSKNFAALAIPKGYAMLCKGGWDEYSGLGPKAGGRLFPVKTTLKWNKEGLGLRKGKAKVTHFKPNDVAAIRPAPASKGKSRKQILSEYEKDKMKTHALRALLSD